MLGGFPTSSPRPRLGEGLLGSIRVVLLTVFAFTPAHAQLGSEASDADEARENAYEIVAILSLATDGLAVERGLTFSALKAGEPSTAAQRDALAARRGEVDAMLLAALRAARESPAFHGRELLARELAAVFDAHAALRAEVGGALAQAPGSRHEELAARWFHLATRVITATERLTQGLQRNLSKSASQARKLIGIQRHMGVMTDYAGRERALIAAAIAAGTPLTDDDLVRLRWYRNRVEAAWRAAEQWSRDTRMHELLASDFGRVHSAFFVDYEALRHSVYEAGRMSGHYPVSVEAWFNGSTRAIESLVDLRKASMTLQARS